MKIEKVNDHQIRCTLTSEDLADRQLKISELAYGSEKAKSLFRDMMQQANFEFGFEAEDIPLMIEAIPVHSDCIVLIITKVEDPDEIDTRFSNFAPHASEEEEEEDSVHPSSAPRTASEIHELFEQLKKHMQTTQSEASIKATKDNEEKDSKDSSKHLSEDNIEFMLSSANLSDLCLFAQAVAKRFSLSSILIKDLQENTYCLFLSPFEELSKPARLQLLSTASEYGKVSSLTFKQYHKSKNTYDLLIKNNALSQLLKY